ncbi:unnamed protein product [Rotaria sp. Silwood1]|nr:unnamed protein product [Rotaria sp. Silwood1]
MPILSPCLIQSPNEQTKPALPSAKLPKSSENLSSNDNLIANETFVGILELLFYHNNKHLVEIWFDKYTAVIYLQFYLVVHVIENKQE